MQTRHGKGSHQLPEPAQPLVRNWTGDLVMPGPQKNRDGVPVNLPFLVGTSTCSQAVWGASSAADTEQTAVNGEKRRGGEAIEERADAGASMPLSPQGLLLQTRLREPNVEMNRPALSSGRPRS